MTPKRELINTDNFRHARESISPSMSPEQLAEGERLHRVLTESANSLFSNLGALGTLPPDDRLHALENFILDVMNGARGPRSNLRFSDEHHPASGAEDNDRPKGIPIIGL